MYLYVKMYLYMFSSPKKEERERKASDVNKATYQHFNIEPENIRSYLTVASDRIRIQFSSSISIKLRP